jgi:hypothetical protein
VITVAMLGLVGLIAWYAAYGRGFRDGAELQRRLDADMLQRLRDENQALRVQLSEQPADVAYKRGLLNRARVMAARITSGMAVDPVAAGVVLRLLDEHEGLPHDAPEVCDATVPDSGPIASH